MQELEKLASFYLGRIWDGAARRVRDELVMYDARNLTTHAVCVGMTGSGKTGLCLGLLEEAAIDGVPVLAIDPKGDVANLALAFPDLAPADFEPWVEPEEARRRGIDVATLAREEAERWRRGLAEWGQDGARIRRLRDAADVVVYTPGSTAGVPVSILRSFAAPPALRGDAEALAERAASTATSVLGMIGVDADPLQSRDHVLLSTILAHAWGEGRDLDLTALVAAIQTPPVARVGVLELETFYPAKERFALAMRLNNVLAAPGFQTWLDGEALDIDTLLFGATGKPRIAIFSIAHLSDAERMFFVSLLLQQTLAWVRTRPGTDSLRAILYMDEIFGFFPPSAEPPSKKPMLTLMKQARAAGLGVVLATQNPVDLDYKGLANAGTWFVGRLQTERDRARLLDGLEAAGGGLDRAAIEARLDQLDKRVFLLHDVHAGAPRLFMTRWTLSYLRGPMTREEIRRLRAAAPGSGPAPEPRRAVAGVAAASIPGAAGAASGVAARTSTTAPVLPPDVPQTTLAARDAAQTPIVYVPKLLGVASVRFAAAKSGVDVTREIAILASVPDSATAAAWVDGVAIDSTAAGGAPAPGARFEPTPTSAAQASSYARWSRELAGWLSRAHQLELRSSARLGVTSRPEESERDFRIRLRDVWRERRDAGAEALRRKYEPKLDRLRDQLQRANAARARESAQAQQQKVQSAISIGATVLGAFLGGGRRGTVGRAATAARGLGRSRKEAADVERAATGVEAVEAKLRALDAEFQAELGALDSGFDPEREPLETVALRLKKADIAVRAVSLAWAPMVDGTDGRRPAWR
jgi:hypothetical protein